MSAVLLSNANDLEPKHDNTYKMTWASIEDSGQQVQPLSLSIFTDTWANSEGK